MGVEIFTCIARRKPKIDVIFFVMNAVLQNNLKKEKGLYYWIFI